MWKPHVHSQNSRAAHIQCLHDSVLIQEQLTRIAAILSMRNGAGESRNNWKQLRWEGRHCPLARLEINEGRGTSVVIERMIGSITALYAIGSSIRPSTVTCCHGHLRSSAANWNSCSDAASATSLNYTYPVQYLPQQCTNHFSTTRARGAVFCVACTSAAALKRRYSRDMEGAQN